MDEQRIKERLLEANPEFRRLHEEHRRHEERLVELAAAPFLSQDDLIHEKELKKLKLVLKDKMALMISDYGKIL
jgi:uncharacterized protein